MITREAPPGFSEPAQASHDHPVQEGVSPTENSKPCDPRLSIFLVLQAPLRKEKQLSPRAVGMVT